MKVIDWSNKKILLYNNTLNNFMHKKSRHENQNLT